jgi:predicted metal-dependent enzyme (double-stranded beta helix superfamily)
MVNLAPLRAFTQSMTRLLECQSRNEGTLLKEGAFLLHRLIARDDWLPDEFARSSVSGYRQYLWYCDPMERFSVVSFVWEPGQRTPVHDHTVGAYRATPRRGALRGVRAHG